MRDDSADQAGVIRNLLINLDPLKPNFHLNYTQPLDSPRTRAVMSAQHTAIFPPAPLRPLVSKIASILTERKQSVAVAETACGGLISAALLSVPGASTYYKGGLTLYTLPSRIAYAGWTEESLKGYS